MDLACAVVVNGAALPHAKVGGAVRPLDVEDQVLEVNSIALLKSQQTFQQSFYSSVVHPVVLELLKSLLKSLLRFQQSY